MGAKVCRRWTQEERDFVEDKWGLISVHSIAKQLNRSYNAIQRYAEKNSDNNRWDIKCCGLTDKIMKQVDDIEVFENCELSQKELNKMTIYTKEDTVYYYYDKECKKKIKGLIKSKKARIVSGGTLIIEQPYAIREKYIMFR